MDRSKSLKIVFVLYLVVLTSGALLTYYLKSNDPIAKLFFIDVCMTLLVFIFSLKYSNASLYDPYWSVIPFAMFFYWLYIFGPEVLTIKIFLTAFVLSFWSWRLTGNWLRSWQGMNNEDWRYLLLKQQTGKWYMMVNFMGIHVFPTLIVFIAIVPLYYIFMFSEIISWITWLGFIIALFGIILELVADNQLFNFKIKENNPIAVMRFGVWQNLRHPNYLGEILFWLGLALLSYTPYTPIFVVSGTVIILLMFIFISIPMIEKRLIQRKPGYIIYKDATWALFPKFRKRKIINNS